MPGAVLLLCDTCCDNAGAIKECLKSGGCTCDICGWSCSCVLGGRQFINTVPVGCIPDGGWAYLQTKNADSLVPINWESFFTGLAAHARGRVPEGQEDAQ